MSNGEIEGSGQIETTAQPTTEQPTTFDPSTPVNLFKCLKERTCPGFDFPEGQQFFPSTPKPRYFPAVETESSDVPPVDGMRTTYIAMIAGGFVLGCLVGIITTVLVYSKRSGGRPRLRRSGRSSGSKAQKNPREQTFEPLDLSLNQSRVSQTMQPTPDTPRRVVEENARGHVVATSQLQERNVITQLSCHSPSYLNFEPPTPPSMTGSNGSEEVEGSVGRRVALPQVKCISFHDFNVSSVRVGRESDASQVKVVLVLLLY